MVAHRRRAGLRGRRPCAGPAGLSGGAHQGCDRLRVLPARAGQIVQEADALRTGEDGTIGVTLKDDTRVSLGPSSEVQLDRFVYAPADTGVALVLKFVRGAAAYVSGRIAKL